VNELVSTTRHRFENPFVFYKHEPPQEWNSVKIQSKRRHDHREANAGTNAQTLSMLHASLLKLVVVLVVGGDLGLEKNDKSVKI
jgi:hypothetical protein